MSNSTKHCDSSTTIRQIKFLDEASISDPEFFLSEEFNSSDEDIDYQQQQKKRKKV